MQESKPFAYQPYIFAVDTPFQKTKRSNEAKIVQRRIKVTVPKSTPWDPRQVERMMTQFFSVTGPLTLGIEMKEDQLIWYVHVHRSRVNSLCQTIYALYPLADLNIDAKVQPRLGYYAFHFHASVPHIYPFKTADELSEFDPLVTLLNLSDLLRGGEQIIYECVLLPADPRVLELGRQLFNERIDSVAYEDNATQLRIFYNKINSPLKTAQLVVKIKAKTPGRANQLLVGLWPALAAYSLDGGNALVTPHRGSFTPVLSAVEAAAFWHPPTEACQFITGIGWTKAINIPLPNQLKLQKEGTVLGTHTFRGQTQTVKLAYPDRDAHVSIIGTTGVGKSTLTHHLVHQDLAIGKAVGVIDPHGDLVNDILKSSISWKCADDVVFFDTYDPNCPISLNPLAVPAGVAPSQVARQALDLVKKLCADDWPGAQTERYFAAALRALVEYPGATFRAIPLFLTDNNFRSLVLMHVTDEQVKQTWLVYNRLNIGSQAKITEPILNRLDRFYSDPLLERIICQPDSLNFREIIDQQKIFLANLGAFQEEREANTLGALLLSKLQFAAMSRGELSKAERQQKAFYLYVDELQRFADTASLQTIYDQARKYGLSLTGAFQRLSQMPGEDLRGVTSSVGVLIIFGTLREDAKTLAPFLDDQISAKELASLDKYTAIVSMRLYGQSLPSFLIRTHPPLSPNPGAEQIIAHIRAHNHQKYGASQKSSRSETPPVSEDNNDPDTIFFAG
jgi:hypothetical protein